MQGEEPGGTLQEEREGAAADGTLRRPQLFVALECDRPTAGSVRHDLAAIDEVAIGRGAERGALRDGRRLRITVPGKWMSSAHARLVREEAAWRLEDQKSTNGSFVNGKRVSTARVHDADVIELGHTIFLLRHAMPVPEGTPEDHESGAGSPLHPALRTLVPSYASRLEGLQRLAPSNLSLLLLGETGTGKEVLAKAVHERSARSGRFVAVNCGALPDSLVESQLFGHVKGAFSGALRDEPGLVRASHGGTLFLDEVGDLRKESQAALLRVLQEREVLPVGGTKPASVDLRVVAATHRPLKDLVARGSFRADLFARLAGFVNTLPPLRQRQEDIGVIVATLLEAMGPNALRGFTPEVGRAFFLYSWPLNVREIQQCLTSSALLASGGVVERAHLPETMAAGAFGEARAAERPVRDVSGARLSDADAQIRSELTSQLEAHRGNVAGAARAMGKAPMQVHRWMKRFGIEPNQYRKPTTAK
ncbi:MAG TPA: sigma 54-interacting transcriptional regulator [Polyangiaceae bacterium]|jgi:DNA-binding NtrC family response regulator